MGVPPTVFRQTLKRPAAKKPSALKALLSVAKLIYSPFSGLVFIGSQMALASGGAGTRVVFTRTRYISSLQNGLCFSVPLTLCDTFSSFIYNEFCS
jgi:hypothetical protein